MVKQQVVTEPPPAVHLRQTEATASSRARRPWWLWPHLLSLDAPVVALVWQDWWSRCTGVPLLPGERFVLGMGVWLIYLADRLADVSRGRPADTGTARHAFAARWQRPLRVLAAAVAASLVVLAPRVLPAREFYEGLGLLAAAAAYFWLIHRGPSPRWTRRLPKEAVVGGMFALGTLFFVLCRPAHVPGLLVTCGGFFGVVCFLNCALITSWEHGLRDRRDPASLLNAFPALINGGLALLCWLTAASAVVLAWEARLFLPVALAAGALAALDRWRRHLSADALRCLADGVLLVPGVCCLVTAMFR